jgi:hypothetical protein
MKTNNVSTKHKLKRFPKKHLVQLAGYNNISALCKDVPSMVRSPKKGPSKKAIIKYLY